LAVPGAPSCLLIEAYADSLGGLAQLLAGWGIGSYRVTAGRAADGSALPPADFVLADTATHAALEAARSFVAERRKGGAPVLALCRLDAPTVISQALAIGFDDALAFPMDQIELKLRVDALVKLVAAEAERRRRRTLLGRYATSEPRRPRFKGERVDDRSAILLVGPASENQVRVGNAGGGARLVYADGLKTARRILAEQAFDLVVVTLPAPRAAPTLRPRDIADTARIGEVGVLLAGPVEEPERLNAMLQAGFSDIIQVPHPPELIRLRRDFWLELGGLRRHLRQPPPETTSLLAIDALSGLFNQGFMLDYLALVRAERRFPEPVVMAFRLADLAEVQASQGHAAANYLVAEIGKRLREQVRAEDLPAHLGNGQFAVATEGLDERTAIALAARIHLAVARQPITYQRAALPLLLQSGASAIRPNDDVPRALIRLFRDLQSRQPRVA
jgi:diguanylate cyclase (GGDEF)-like protein